jgi:hypothetical protein
MCIGLPPKIAKYKTIVLVEPDFHLLLWLIEPWCFYRNKIKGRRCSRQGHGHYNHDKVIARIATIALEARFDTRT